MALVFLKMTKELAYAVNYLLGRDVAGRSLAVLPDDTFLVSFPRSGNTWMRFLVSNIVHAGHEVSFENVDRLIPEISKNSKRYLNSLPRPRILKSHESLDLRYPRVVYIVRDPRDVAVSGYHFFLKRKRIDETLTIGGFVGRLLRLEFWEDFGTWAENVGGWLGARLGTEGFLLVRYEDMLRQPEAELAKVATLLGVEADPKSLATAVERSKFLEMQKLETLQSDNWFLTKETRKDIAFVRGGAAGGWKAALPSESVEAIERAWGYWMSFLGYDPVSSEAPVAAPVAAGALLAAHRGLRR